MPPEIQHSCRFAQVQKSKDAGPRPTSTGKPSRRRGKTPAGVPAITAPIERRWECLIQFDRLLSPGERAFVNDLGQPKHWRGEKLSLSVKQQAWLAKIFAGLRACIAGGRAHG